MNFAFIVFGVIFVVAFLMILGTSGFVFFNVFRIFNRVTKNIENAQVGSETHIEKKRRAMEIMGKGAPAYKCKSCGATVDSTAELAADGRVRCNYCNQWSSIYQ